MPLLRKPVKGLKNRSKSLKKERSWGRRLIRRIIPILIKATLLLILLGSLLLAVALFVIYQEMPDIHELSDFLPSETTKIYSADNIVLADLHFEENRIRVSETQIAPAVKLAIVAIEDKRFYEHFGLDLRGIARAAVVNVLSLRMVEGGSTLTQQLARNVFLSHKRNWIRKLAEAVMAIRIEKYYTKDEILELYFNQVYWGHNCYGIEAASRFYFGKPASKLDLAESALLAGIIKGPETYSPYRNMDGAKARQKMVLDRMADQGMITVAQAEKAFLQPLELTSKKKERYKAPYFTSYVVEQLVREYGQERVYHQGLRVYTTLDYQLQEVAEKVVSEFIKEGEVRRWPARGWPDFKANYEEAAMLSIDPRTGYIKVLVGGSDFRDNKFNHVTQAKRQPGSSFKPFTYLTALNQGFSPGSVLEDAPVTYNTMAGDYSPKNFTKIYHGPLPLQEALQRSINNIAVRLINLIGPSNVARTAHQLGIESELNPVLSLALGSSEVSMLEMTKAYGVLANKGVLVAPTAITKITDREGNVLYQHIIKEKAVYDQELIAILVAMMQRVVQFGTGSNARLPGRQVAGKTGTSNDYKDAWFIGFIPQMVTAAWVGNDQNVPMEKVTGGSHPARMWQAFMKEATKEIRGVNFSNPTTLVSMRICRVSGLLPGETCPNHEIDYLPFQRDAVPTQYCWYNHHFPRNSLVNARPIVPLGWENRNIYEEIDRPPPQPAITISSHNIVVESPASPGPHDNPVTSNKEMMPSFQMLTANANGNNVW